MSYGIRYRISYYRKSGGRTTIDIRDKSFVSDSITDLLAAGDPLSIPFDGDVSDIYKPTLGSGCTIKVMTTPLTMDALFTNDPQKFIVKIYNGASGSSLVWQGFVNTEIFTESYSTPVCLKSEITINCNDGMSLLDKIKYKTSADAYYLGTVNISEIFDNILLKLSIVFINIYTSNDLTIKKAPSPETNPFLYLQLPNEDFVDESGEAMSCRQVLDSIMRGLGLVMFFLSDTIYIIDPINLHVVAKGKSYLRSTFAEVGQIDIGGYLDISTKEIRWYETGAQRDIESQVDQVILKYDPFTFCSYEYDFNKSENLSIEGTFSDVGTYWYNEDVEFVDWTNEYDESVWNPYSVGIQEDVANVATGSPTYVIDLYDHGAKIKYTLPNFHSVTQDENLQLRLSFDVWVQTNSNDLNIFAGIATSHVINYIKIPICVSVGNQHWRGGNTWGTSADPSNYQPLLVIEEGKITADPAYLNSVINDKWVKGSMTVPLKQSVGQDLISGNITVEIFDSLKSLFFANQIEMSVNTAFVYHVLLKNMVIEIINASTGKVVINEGVTFKAFLSTNLTGKDGFEINTVCGTGIYGSSKAAFKSDQQAISGINIAGLYRDTETTIHDTAKLILQSFISQYKQPRFKLIGNLDVHEYLLPTRLKLIQDTNYQDPSDKAFYIVGGTYHDREETMEVTMIELTDTREAIT